MGGGAQPAATAAEVNSGCVLKAEWCTRCCPWSCTPSSLILTPTLCSSSFIPTVQIRKLRFRKVPKPVNARFQPRLMQPEPKVFTSHFSACLVRIPNGETPSQDSQQRGMKLRTSYEFEIVHKMVVLTHFFFTLKFKQYLLVLSIFIFIYRASNF